jgi:hypothetical protein
MSTGVALRGRGLLGFTKFVKCCPSIRKRVLRVPKPPSFAVEPRILMIAAQKRRFARDHFA